MEKRLLLIILTGIILLAAADKADAGLIVQRPLYIGLTEGLVGYWSFDAQDMAGERAYDKSGQGNTGLLTNGPARKTGRIGQALEFDGVNDWMNGGSQSSLNFGTGSFSVSFWIKTNSNGDAFIANKNFTTGLYQGWVIYVNTNKVSWNIGDGTNRADLFGSTGNANSIIDNNWHHVIVVFDRATNLATPYVDGKYDYVSGSSRVINISAVGSVSTPSGLTTNIGADGRGTAYFSKGIIDDVRIYNRALSTDEIKRLYKIGATTKINVPRKDALTEGLVGYWTFDGPDVAGNVSYDQSVNSNHGTTTTATDFTVGRIGQALNSSQQVDVGSGSSLNTTDNTHTFVVWIKKKASDTSGTIINKRGTTGGSGGGYTAGISISPCATNEIKASKYGVVDICVGSFPADTSWHHLAVVWSSSGVTAYIDGVVSSPTSSNTSNFTSSTRNLFIGSFGGILDDVRIYNRALSPDEIKRLYKIGSTLKINVPRKDTLTEGLVGYWSFDGPDMAGVTAYDRSGQGNNGTLTNGPVRKIGRIGQALDFDGVNDYVDTSSSVIANSNPFTISVWIKDNNNNNVISRGADGSGAGWSIALGGSASTGSALNFSIVTTSGGPTQYIVTGATPLKSGTWNHIVGVWTPGVGLTAYLNGVLDGTTLTTSNTLRSSTVGVRFGFFNGTTYLSGLIDDVRIYNRALSADEIKRLYNMGR